MRQLNLLDGAGAPAGDAYAAFAAQLRASNCDKCDLHAERTTIVVDRGNPAAQVVIIGEGPGKEEDLAGRAFVGRAGKTLDQFLGEVGIDTNADTLIVNVVKCRPPGNRAPKKAEAAACLPYLRTQLELTAPALVVLLGATALKHLDPSKKKIVMADEVGTMFGLPAWPGVQFMVLYHPAALLYNRSLMPEQQRFAAMIRDFMDAEGLPRSGSPKT